MGVHVDEARRDAEAIDGDAAVGLGASGALENAGDAVADHQHVTTHERIAEAVDDKAAGKQGGGAHRVSTCSFWLVLALR